MYARSRVMLSGASAPARFHPIITTRRCPYRFPSAQPPGGFARPGGRAVPACPALSVPGGWRAAAEGCLPPPGGWPGWAGGAGSKPFRLPGCLPPCLPPPRWWPGCPEGGGGRCRFCACFTRPPIPVCKTSCCFYKTGSNLARSLRVPLGGGWPGWPEDLPPNPPGGRPPSAGRMFLCLQIASVRPGFWAVRANLAGWCAWPPVRYPLPVAARRAAARRVVSSLVACATISTLRSAVSPPGVSVITR